MNNWSRLKSNITSNYKPMAYAYVTVLYGNNIYLTGALVLGYSLMKTKTLYDCVILVTPDVSLEYRSLLEQVFTHVISIDYVKVNPKIFSEEDTRFRDVFTKLECLNLVQYDKIILLDLDMIILKNLDHLFKLDPPAACLKRHHIRYGQKIPSEMVCLEHKLVGSINAGLMLLKPDIQEWTNIKTEINHNTQIHQFKYPEQDYLSLRYCHSWTSIPFNYNFQFGLTHRVKKMHFRIEDIYVIHYSSSYKPWNDLLTHRTMSPEELEFKAEHQKYYTMWTMAYHDVKEKFAKEHMALPY